MHTTCQNEVSQPKFSYICLGLFIKMRWLAKSRVNLLSCVYTEEKITNICRKNTSRNSKPRQKFTWPIQESACWVVLSWYHIAFLLYLNIKALSCIIMKLVTACLGKSRLGIDFEAGVLELKQCMDWALGLI